MTGQRRAARFLALAMACGASTVTLAAHATPSTAFWTPATTYVQPFAVPHITYDTYFSGEGAYPIDTGLEIGVLPFSKFQMEVGFDAFLPDEGFFLAPGPFQLNAKLGIPNSAFGKYSPGVTAGIYGVGFTDSTSFDIIHGEVSETLPIGTLTAGAYYGAGGDDVLWTSSKGSLIRGGAMGSYTTPDIMIGLKGLYKINFFADIMSGTNAYGGGGGGVGLYFTPAIDVLTGPVFFLDSKLQPPFTGDGSPILWSVQLDVDLDFHKDKPAEAAPVAAPPPAVIAEAAPAPATTTAAPEPAKAEAPATIGAAPAAAAEAPAAAPAPAPAAATPAAAAPAK